MDSGSCISTISEHFYNSHLKDREIKELGEILNIECADGSKLPYIGYISATLTTIGIPKSTDQECLFLVTPQTNYSTQTPVLLGTNILNELMLDCKTNFGITYLQKAKMETPWHIAFRCISIRERDLKKNNNRIGVVRSADRRHIILGPNESIDVTGYVDKEMNFYDTNAILQESEESNLPSFVDITPSVINYSYKKNGEIK